MDIPALFKCFWDKTGMYFLLYYGHLPDTHRDANFLVTIQLHT